VDCPHILAVYGTRPEVIKLAPVISCLRETDGVRVTALSTGQHRDLAPLAERSLDLSPDDSLDVMREGQPPERLLARATELLVDLMGDISADMVVVQGDTTTSLAAAQAAFYCRVETAHVEAGIRSHNIYAPFPEEMNRRLITTLATLHMAPTAEAADNLSAAGVEKDRIFITGNTVIDTLAKVAGRVSEEEVLIRFGIPVRNRLILATLHRRESWGERLEGISRALAELVDSREDCFLALPVHPNPAVRDTVRGILAGRPRVLLLDALPYEDFVGLLKSCYLVVSDSGGIQEEAPFLGRPVVVARDETDRPEAIRSGGAVLASTDPGRVKEATAKILDSRGLRERMAASRNPYGDGRAAERVVGAILSHFGRGVRPEDLS